MVARTTFALLLVGLVLGCTASAEITETTTGGGAPALECLYDFDCGEQAACHHGTCVMQCESEGEACCTLVGDCDPASPCESTEDCPDDHICQAGLCRAEPAECSPPPAEQVYG